MRELIALVACSAVVLWAWRVWWDENHPMEAASRGLGSGDPSRRAEAIRVVSVLSFRRPDEAIRLLIPMLKDRDAGVRAAVADSLGRLASDAIGVAGGAGEVAAATAALLELAKDTNDRVRAEAMMSLATIVTAATRPGRGLRSSPRRHRARPWTSMSTPCQPLWSVSWPATMSRYASQRSSGWAPWPRGSPADRRRS